MSCYLQNYENLQRHGQETTEVTELGGNQGSQVVGKSSDDKKGRKRESKVWEEMIKEKGEGGMVHAKCVHCKKVFNGSSKKGTTHLKIHLDRCRRKIYGGGEDADKKFKTSDFISSIAIKEKPVIDLIKNGFDKKGNPTEDWDPSVLRSRKIDLLQLFDEEKERILRFLSQLRCRFSLRIEWFWGWYFLTAHYTDDNWEPKRKFIGFENGIQCDQYGNLIAILKESCLAWKIDRNICCIVVDYHKNDKGRNVIEESNSWFIQRSSLPFSGLLFPIEALSHIFNTLYICMEYCVWDRFNEIKKCIDYVNKTPLNQQKFQMAVDTVKSVGKEVTYRPLPEFTPTFSFRDFEDVLGYREAFCELKERDSDFTSVSLTKEQWDAATVAHKYVEELKGDIDRSLSEIKSATPTMYFPKFCALYMKLLARENAEGYHLGNAALPLIQEFTKIVRESRESFEKYWHKYSLVIVILAILDPRFKMDIVKRWYIKIYGNEARRHFKKTFEDFTVVYNGYAEVTESEEPTTSIPCLDDLGMPCTSLHDVSRESELHHYLNAPKFASFENFEVLVWWRLNTQMFPTLARMARDFLAIPISDGAATSFSMVDVNVIECVGDCEGLDNEMKRALLYLTRWGKFLQSKHWIEISKTFLLFQFIM